MQLGTPNLFGAHLGERDTCLAKGVHHRAQGRWIHRAINQHCHLWSSQGVDAI